MMQQNKNERGAIIIEVIAVIALLGVLGPLLFRQVLSRNEEVDNINLASEIRSVKEAFSAYILTNKETLKGTMAGCEPIDADALIDYMPYGMDTVVADYNLILCSISADTTAPVFLQGFIVPTADLFPDGLGLRQSARIATLIGADGGIYQNGEVNGIGGAWGIDTDMLGDLGVLQGVLVRETQKNERHVTYLATTGMDTYVPEYIVEDYSSGFVTIPDNLAFKELHAGEYFAIGGSGTCYTQKHQTITTGQSGYKAQDDNIKRVGTDNCDPLFWVGVNGGSGSTDPDKSKAGRVYVKNGLEIGRRNDKDRSAVGIYGHSDLTDAGTTYAPGVSENNRIEVYDNTGTAKVWINGKGEIVAVSSEYKKNDDNSVTTGAPGSSDEQERLTIANGAITSNIRASDANDVYKVDPAYTSVMKDIKLESRGGARLSEILPNYISKTVQTISGSEATVDMPNPKCPEGYAPAIIVLPVSWEKVKITPSDLEDGSESKLKLKANTPVKVESANASASHSHEASISDPADVELKSDIEAANAGLVIKIDSNADGHIRGAAEDEENNKWKVTFYYPGGTTPRTDVKAIAQTYCVYDTTYSGTLDRP